MKPLDVPCITIFVLCYLNRGFVSAAVVEPGLFTMMSYVSCETIHLCPGTISVVAMQCNRLHCCVAWHYWLRPRPDNILLKLMRMEKLIVYHYFPQQNSRGVSLLAYLPRIIVMRRHFSFSSSFLSCCSVHWYIV
eukprot:scaffold145660_cov21-Tisochrysis_lutea.AAC.1